METAIQFIADKFYYVFLGLLGAYVIMKFRNRNSGVKRRFFFILAIGVFLLYTSAILVIQNIIPEFGFYLLTIAVIAGEYYFIRKSWIFRMDCVKCARRMDWNQIIMDDRNLCSDCLEIEEEGNAGSDVETEKEEDTFPEE